MTPYDPIQTQQTTQPKLPQVQLPVAAGSSPQVQPAPALARGIGGAMAPQGSAAQDIGQAKPMTAPAPTPQPSANQKELTRLEGSKPGVQQVKNPFLRTLATVGDVLASTFAPRAAQVIPGTTAHHEMLLGQAGNAVRTEEEQADNASKRALEGANAAHTGAETDTLIPAQANHLNAETHALQNPSEKISPENEQKTIETDQGIFQWNPESKRYDISVGKGKGQKEAGAVHTLDDGTMIIARPDGTALPVTMNGQPVKAPQRATGEHIIERTVQGRPHSIMVDAQGNDVKDLGEKYEKPNEGAQGTWALEEQDGKPVLFNSRSGAVRPAPQGLAKTGTAEKQAAPRDALNYAQQYVSSGHFTGAGDEALMEKFFELAKPSSGFRMTQNQQDMLMHTRDLMQGGSARLKHALDPNAPYFDDTQRQNIVKTMSDLAAAKGLKSEGGGGGFKAGDTQVKSGVTYQRDDKGQWHPQAH